MRVKYHAVRLTMAFSKRKMDFELIFGPIDS